MQAWMNHQVTGTTEKGTPVYKSFKEFFDYESEIKTLNNKKEKISPHMRKLAKIAARVNEGR